MGGCSESRSRARERLDRWRWYGRMALRDSRGHRRKLVLYALCMVFGVGALTAISSFRHNLVQAVDLQARSLLGADLVIRSRRPFSAQTRRFLAQLGGEQATETRFPTMAYFVDEEVTRLVQVRALQGAFPFYGKFETAPMGLTPAEADRASALVEESLVTQVGLGNESRIRLGNAEFGLAGSLLRIAGESAIAGIFSPRIYIHHSALAGTGLVQRGSIVSYRRYFRFADGLDAERLRLIEAAEKSFLGQDGVRYDTVEKRKRSLGRSIDNLYGFMNLVAFVALLLGGLGVAAGVQVYIREKMDSIAVLRCLGARTWAAFAIFLLQVAITGLVGAVAGVSLGVGVQFLLPPVLNTFLPFEVEVVLAPGSLIGSFLFGWSITCLFALIPLLEVRTISPIRALRASVEPPHTMARDPWIWMLLALLLAAVLGFSVLMTRELSHAFGFVGGLLLAFTLLSLLAWIIRHAMKRAISPLWPFSLRQGLANLYRPRNRTLLLMVTVGLGTFLVYTIFLIERGLLAEIRASGARDRPDLVFFDVQIDQVDGVAAAIQSAGYPVMETVPIVSMRVSYINGRDVLEIRNDPNRKAERWALDREYRSTYRDRLIETETLLAGEFEAHWDGQEPVPVSLEQDIARDLDVGLGDVLRFDVQGVTIEVTVAGIRKVDWQRMRPNFFVVFPHGVLEAAPAFFALVTRIGDRLATARLQRRVVEEFPNVSAIDLALVLETITTILDRVGFVIGFMGAFTVATGFVVLAVAMVTSRYQRAGEAALLRVMGARGGLVRKVIAIEYLFLGLIGGIAGAFLAQGAYWALARFVFEIEFNLDYHSFFAAVLVAVLATLGTGLMNSRGLLNLPPLEVIRQEV